MVLVYKTQTGEYRRFDTDAAVWLGGTRESRGRWFDIYRTSKGLLIRVDNSLWVGEKRFHAEEIDEDTALNLLVDECDSVSADGHDFIDELVPLDEDETEFDEDETELA